jgi:anaerobic dimethyl sulfoxide reductase subunit A
MDKRVLLEHWRQCHRLVQFFTGEAPSQDYDDLFRGVRADIYIPLWASAVRGGHLLDRTCRDILRRYHAWGYEPVPMEGNPPDFIGQQFRFLCYLYACAVYAREHGAPPEPFEREARDFTRSFLAETACSVAAGIRSHGKFTGIAGEMEDFIRGPLPGEDSRGGGEAWGGEPEMELSCYDVRVRGPSPPLPEDPPGPVKIAGRNNCGGRCGVLLTVEEGCITGLYAGRWPAGEPKIRPCMRGMAYRETFLDGRRLRYPMRRIGERGEGRFRRVTWDEAAEICAEAWVRVRDRYGPASRYVNYATGVDSLVNPTFMARRLLNLDGGHLGYYNSYSSACVRFTTPFIYGDNFSGNSPEDILNSRLLILWGHNPRETVFGSERAWYVTQAKKQGLRVIVIDPRESDTVRFWADEWIPLRPSTDAALADALAYVILSEGMADRRFMDACCQGFDEAHLPPGTPPNQSCEAYLLGRQDGVPKTPAWAEAITGVPRGRIESLAREYAAAKPACLLPGLGLQRTGSGEQTVRGLIALACITGNVGVSGGGAAGTGAIPGLPLQGYPVPPNPYPGKIPSFLWTRALEDARSMTAEGDGLTGVDRLDTDIKLILNLAGNTLVNQHGDINRTIGLLKDPGKAEFILCSDVFMTPSARFADLLLPGSSFFEEEAILAPWDFGDYLLYGGRAVEPLFGCRGEYEFLADLARRLGLYEAWSEGHTSVSGWHESLYRDIRAACPDFPDYETFRTNGGFRRERAAPYVAYADQVRDPAGHPFATPSGRIELYSPRLAALGRPDEVPPIPRYVPCPEGPEDPLRERFPLQLIAWHTKRSTHSVQDNTAHLERAEPQRLWIHPDDAAGRDIGGGDLVEVFNDRGRIRLPAFVTTRIMRGVIAMPQGGWYSPDADGVDRRGSVNVLTSQRPTPLARGNAQHTCLAEARKAEMESR